MYIYMLPPPQRPTLLRPFSAFLTKNQQRRPKSRVVNRRVMKDSYTSQTPISQHWINLHFESEGTMLFLDV